MLAHASVDILKNAKVFPDLQSAVKDVDFVIGTTSKHRILKGDYYSTGELLSLIKNKEKSVNKVAIVFGREDKGLMNDELHHCNIVSRIPMKNSYPSLNLAQAVMIYAYSLSPLVLGDKGRSYTISDQAQFKVLRESVAEIMQKIGVDPGSSIYNRIIERLGALRDGDIHLMHSVCNMLLQNYKACE
jgi:tRNA/rRNA methyltransferase